MTKKHYPDMCDNLRKYGLSVKIKPSFNPNPEERAKEEARNFENGMKNLKRLIQNDGLIKELRLREAYESKGQRRRRRKEEAIRRYRKKRRMEEVANA